MGKGGGGGMPVGRGSGCRELSMQLCADAHSFGDWTIFEVPVGWGREGWGDASGIGECLILLAIFEVPAGGGREGRGDAGGSGEWFLRTCGTVACGRAVSRTSCHF